MMPVLCIIAIAALSFMTSSCHDAIESEIITSKSKSSNEFLGALEDNLSLFLNTEMIEGQSTLSAAKVPIKHIDSLPYLKGNVIYLDSTASRKPFSLDTIKTPRQIIDLVRNAGVQISLVNDGAYTNSISLSESECTAALQPLVADSKQYLYGKGFSEVDIQRMLLENGATELALIPFVTALAEEEEYQNSHPSTGNLSTNFDNNSILKP